MFEDRTNQEAVDEIIVYWDKELEKVLSDKPDIIVLPEECDSNPFFSGERKMDFINYRGNIIREHFSMVAAKHNTNIAYAAIRKDENGDLRNSIQIINRKGGIDGAYDKNHLVIFENDQFNIKYGTGTPIIDCDFGKVACLICFDLNFEELRLKYEKLRPELLLFSSMYHGGLRQNYYAYSLRAHFAASISGLKSGIISPIGEVIGESTNYYNYVTRTVNLDCKVIHLDHNRPRIRKALDKYAPAFKMTDPGYLGAVMISSGDEKNISEYVEEFQFELLDDYFDRSIKHRNENI